MPFGAADLGRWQPRRYLRKLLPACDPHALARHHADTTRLTVLGLIMRKTSRGGHGLIGDFDAGVPGILCRSRHLPRRVDFSSKAERTSSTKIEVPVDRHDLLQMPVPDVFGAHKSGRLSRCPQSGQPASGSTLAAPKPKQDPHGNHSGYLTDVPLGMSKVQLVINNLPLSLNMPDV